MAARFLGRLSRVRGASHKQCNGHRVTRQWSASGFGPAAFFAASKSSRPIFAARSASTVHWHLPNRTMTLPLRTENVRHRAMKAFALLFAMLLLPACEPRTNIQQPRDWLIVYKNSLYETPDKPEQVYIAITTNDGKRWEAKWVPKAK